MLWEGSKGRRTARAGERESQARPRGSSGLAKRLSSQERAEQVHGPAATLCGGALQTDRHCGRCSRRAAALPLKRAAIAAPAEGSAPAVLAGNFFTNQ